MALFRLLIFILLFPLVLSAQTPPVEVRATWLTTNWGLDWPTQGTSVQSQKEELRRILDRLHADNFNTILFQVRAQGAVFYKSSIEPLSPFFNHSEGFDPLAFAVDECHKRGMECHAWFITFPMDKAQFTTKSKRRKVVVMNKPDYYKLIDDRWYLDPGRPETKDRLVALVKEVIKNYDVDGVHFDYIRYPSNTRQFPDEDTFRKYGKGKSLYDWRRENINNIVSSIYDAVKDIKPWVQVSSSPLGRYKVLPEVSPNDGWTAYNTVFQDAGYWMQSGKHDLVFPMMYHREKLFYPFLDDWVKNSNGRLVIPGLGVYQMEANEQNWDLGEVIRQIDYTRLHKVPGQAYFRTGNILDNLKGIKDSIQSYYPYPAKLPPLTWLDNEAPNSPVNLEVYKDSDGLLCIKWDAPENSEDFTYTVYFSSTENTNTNDAPNILSTGLRSNNIHLSIGEGEFGFYYSVSASDRYHNESVPCFPAYFSHSKYEQ